MKVAVIGLGRLGAPLAVLAASRGHEVMAIDVDERPVLRLLHGQPPVDETGLEELMRRPMLGVIRASTDPALVSETELSLVVVPTPSGPDGLFTPEYVVQAVRQIGLAAPAKHVVVVVSTLTPGSMDGPVRRELEMAAQRSLGPRFGLVYAPQLIALGSVLADLQKPDLVILGCSDQAAHHEAVEFFTSLHDGYPTWSRMRLEEAEVAKLAINAYVTMKMSFANVLGEIAAARSLRPEVIAAVVGADSRIGRKYLTPATAYGGPCFPRDSKAFAAYARTVGASPELADATGRVNERQHTRVVQWTRTQLNAGDGKAVGVLGLAYKVGTHVTDESAGLAVVKQLNRIGIPVAAHDPQGEALGLLPAVQLKSAQDVVDSADVVLIMTPWPEYAQLEYGAKPVFDPWQIRK